MCFHSFGKLNLSSTLFVNHSSIQSRFTVSFLYLFFIIACIMAVVMKQSFAILKIKKLDIKNKSKEITQPKTISSLRKRKKIFSNRKKIIKEYFLMQIMCCFLLHNILKMRFEGLNLMCCCAKLNKYYQILLLHM